MLIRKRQAEPVLVLGGTGKTGRRVAHRLQARSVPVRIGSRTGVPPFDWTDPSTWPAAVRGTRAAYLAYAPDLAVPGAVETVAAFTEAALAGGIQRLVLLSGRGEEEAQRAEDAVRSSGAEWTIVRSAFFSQNFTESFMSELIVGGELVLPAGKIPEPFIDADDIADIAAAALTDDRHAGHLYEVTGPRLLTFDDAVAEISRATGLEIRYTQVAMEVFTAALREQLVPDEYISLLEYLFGTVLDGRNAHLGDGVQRALGRAPRDFRDFARAAAASGVWAPPASDVA